MYDICIVFVARHFLWKYIHSKYRDYLAIILGAQPMRDDVTL